jgi:hypothetical protein
MPNQITGAPVPYDAGLSFNYANWTAQTVLSLVNVPWNNDYRDVVYFPGANAAERRAALNAYIDSRETVGARIENNRYAPVNQPIRIATPFNAAFRFNYIRVHNPMMPIDGDQQRDYYYFITNVVYIAPNTTEITVQLDIFQTFMYDAQLGRCYIERGHIGIANANQMNNYGREYLTIPEGLDIGGEYQIAMTATEKVMDPYGDIASGYNILVVSTTDLNADPGTETDPHLISSNGSQIQGMMSGAEHYIFSSKAEFQNFLFLRKNQPWVLQGIISITLIPSIRRYDDAFAYLPHAAPTFAAAPPSGILKARAHKGWVNWREYLRTTILPTRYQNLKKLLTYPYCVIEMTTYSGTPLMLKPEAWASADADYFERAALVPPNQRIIFVPMGYNRRNAAPLVLTGTYGPGDDDGEYLDLQTQISNFPTMAIVNNGAIQYMAANANSIAYQHRAADWSQQRALAGNQNSYDQASSGISTANTLNSLSRAGDQASVAQSNLLAWQQAQFSAGLGIGGGAVNGLMSGGVAGMAAGGIAGAAGAGLSAMQLGMQTDSANAQQNIRNTVGNAQNRAAQNNNSFVRDTNKSLGDWAARGDYETSIAAINAKVQDAQLIQPTTVGQVGGEAANLIFNDMGMSLRWKIIDVNAMRVIGEYWLRYGYAIRQFVVVNQLQVMSKFTYWKMLETYFVSAPMPEPFKQALRGLFEKGVTVWNSPADIGVTDMALNTPLTGITL